MSKRTFRVVLLVDVEADNRLDEERARESLLNDPPHINRGVAGGDGATCYSFDIRNARTESVRKATKFKKGTR